MSKEHKIQTILNSLDGMERSAPKPFFYGRLQERLHPSGKLERVINLISRPVVAIAAVMLIIICNAYAMLMAAPDTNAKNTATTEIASVDEYTQMNTTFFDIEKPNP